MNADAHGTALYGVETFDPAQGLCRILGLFAQQDRALDSVIARRRGEGIRATIRLSDIDLQRARVLAEKLRALALVARVEFSFAPAERPVRTAA